MYSTSSSIVIIACNFTDNMATGYMELGFVHLPAQSQSEKHVHLLLHLLIIGQEYSTPLVA